MQHWHSYSVHVQVPAMKLLCLGWGWVGVVASEELQASLAREEGQLAKYSNRNDNRDA